MSDTLTDPMAAAAAPPEPSPAAIAPPRPVLRDPPADLDPARAAHVQRLLADIQAAKEHWKHDFQRMRWSADFASGLQWPGQQGYDDDRYRLNIVLRHIRQRTAALYAKHPKAVYRRKPRLDFALWDERPETLQMAMLAVQVAQAAAQQAMMGHNGGPPMALQPPMPPGLAQQILDDYRQGMERRMRAERVGRALEILWDWFMREPIPNVKLQMKAMVRRAITTGVAYMKLGFQRALGPRPDQTSRIADLTAQLATIERLRAALADNAAAVRHCDAEAEELRQALLALQREPVVVLREGPVLDFPRSTAIIPDPRTRSLRGWIGTDWIAEEFELPVEAVQEIYGVDLSSTTAARVTDNSSPQHLAAMLSGDRGKATARFWQVHHRGTGQVYTVAEGWPDYLEEPRAPEVKLERFFPYYTLTFNDIEHEKRVFPPSDVELLRSPQEEFNRTKESLRQHRIANRPLYVSPTGAFEKQETETLAGYPAHAVVKLNNLKEGQNVKELLQPVEKVPIDPNAYETESLFVDVLRAVGSQEANLGGTSGDTATEVSVAEASRLSAVASDTDDLDETLTELARDFGQVCLAEMSAEKVAEIVGPGVQWPVLTRAEIAAELELTVEAGSSGRPNRDRDLANFERIAPYLLQMPDVDSVRLLKHMVRLVDDRVEVTDFIRPGAPSITALNSMAKPATGNPRTEPTQQGDKGADNAPATDVRPRGPQPAYGPAGNPVGPLA